MTKKQTGMLLVFMVLSIWSNGQDTLKYQLRLNVPLLDLPQNYELPYAVPSMNQALEISNDFYELSFWGIEKLGDKLFIPKNKEYSKGRKITNGIFKYGLSLAFSKYGSELPIPLGVWAHEEYHRSVLGVNDISSKNGNWIFNRWDGTVYGISDETLSELKNNDLNDLLYSYVAGVQYEISLSETNSLRDFYKRRSPSKNALLLYNAWYVYDYFKFSTSSASDSVKVEAPADESKDPMERDFAGADLTAWAYDMFNPELPYTSRDSFPGGDGVNRRVGFSDLSPEAQDYLEKQRGLSLLNFLNPAIFFINRIKISNDFSFNFFAQYSPTHFGNDIAVFLPVKYKKYDILVNYHNYSNYTSHGMGVGLGIYNLKLREKLETDLVLNMWNQPESFYDNDLIFGGLISFTPRYNFRNNFAGYVSVTGKTNGWALSNPYLNSNVSVQLGLHYHL